MITLINMQFQTDIYKLIQILQAKQIWNKNIKNKKLLKIVKKFKETQIIQEIMILMNTKLRTKQQKDKDIFKKVKDTNIKIYKENND